MSAERITRRTFVTMGAVAVGTVALGGGAVMAASWAPEAELPSMKMGAGMNKVLVVYATKSGCTTDVAKKVGDTLAEHGASVDVVPAEKAGGVAGYDAVVVGSGVRMGQWHESARNWVAANADALKALPVAFYTCNLTLAQEPGKTDEVKAYTDPLIEATGVKPIDVGVFAGWNEPKKFSLIERVIMKAMKAPQGDFRDFAAIGSWASEVAPGLGLS
jgi:menaquinone-dependent protoporphyrinogen oxidase